jgi:hypothetical protein
LEREKTMSDYLFLDETTANVLSYSYISEDIRDQLYESDPNIGSGMLAEFLLCVQDKYKAQHQRFENYSHLLKSLNYKSVILPRIGLMPVKDKDKKAYMPENRPLDFIKMGGAYYFVSLRLKTLIDRYEIKSAYWDAYLEMETGSRYHPYYLWSPLTALDATDREHSEFTMDNDNDSVVSGIRPAVIEKLRKLFLDRSKIPDNAPFFFLGFTSQSIPLIRQDIAEEIRSLGYTGMEFKRIEDCEWMY